MPTPGSDTLSGECAARCGRVVFRRCWTTTSTSLLKAEKRTAGKHATEEFNMVHPTDVIGGTYATAAGEEKVCPLEQEARFQGPGCARGLGRPAEARGKLKASAYRSVTSLSTHDSHTELLGHKPDRAGSFGGNGRPAEAEGKPAASVYWSAASSRPNDSLTELLRHEQATSLRQSSLQVSPLP